MTQTLVNTESWPLQRQCELIARIYGLWASGLTIANYALNGGETVVQWRYRILNNHQRGYFLEGLRKLGIDPEREPPAVVAGKYHFFSNALGGIDMEYVEESPKKVWIRYNAPLSPAGTGWIAIPPRMGRAIFAGWHAHNGRLLGNLRLGFVLTRGYTEDEPYAEGYFLEYDHELAPDERIQYDSVSRTPSYDPDTAPKLDPDLWPPERKAKALRNFGRGYVEESITALLQMLGIQSTCAVVARAFRGIAIQHGRELLANAGIKDRSAAALADFAKLMCNTAGETAVLSSPSPGRYVLKRTQRRLFPPSQAPVEVHRAMFTFFETLARMMNDRTRATLVSLMDERAAHDEMVFEEAGS